jgi:hypothetical protein
MRLAILATTLGLLTACASAVPEVHVTEDARSTAPCTYIGLVSSERSLGDAAAIHQMSAEVRDRGGDTLLLSHGPGDQGLWAHGEAYRCGHGGAPHGATTPAPPLPQ